VLRERVYGRSAGAPDDQTLDRLRELEHVDRMAPTPRRSIAPGSPGAADEVPVPSTTSPDLASDGRGRGWLESRLWIFWLRRGTVCWLVSLLVVAVSASAVTAYIVRSQAPPGSTGVTQIARLKVSEYRDVSALVGQTRLSAVYDFRGLKIASSKSSFASVQPVESCVTAMSSEQFDEIVDSDRASFKGAFFQGCGVNDFPAEVIVTVNDEMP